MVIQVSNARIKMNNVRYDEVVAVEHEIPLDDPVGEEAGEIDEENDPYAPLSPPGENRMNNQEDVIGGFDNEILQVENNNNNLPNDEPPPEYENIARQPLDAVELQRWRNLRDDLVEFQNVIINHHRLNHREPRYMPFSPADTPSSSNSPNRELEVSDEEVEQQPSTSQRNNYLHDMFAKEIGDLRLADRLTRKRKNATEGNEPPGKKVHFGGMSDVIEPGTRKRKSTEKYCLGTRKHKKSAHDAEESCSTSSYERRVFSKKRDSPDDDDDNSGQGFGGTSQQNNSVIDSFGPISH